MVHGQQSMKCCRFLFAEDRLVATCPEVPCFAVAGCGITPAISLHEPPLSLEILVGSTEKAFWEASDAKVDESRLTVQGSIWMDRTHLAVGQAPRFPFACLS
jgi:hypothetical protein